MNNPNERDRDTIITMLQQFRAAQETMLRGEPSGNNEPWKMPATWTPEMRELERCLALLAHRQPKHHRHIMARYVDPTMSRRTMPGRITRLGAHEIVTWPQLGPHAEVRIHQKLPEHKTTSTYTCLLATWPAWVNKPVCEQGIDKLVHWYQPPSSDAVGPELPIVKDDTGKHYVMAA